MTEILGINIMNVLLWSGFGLIAGFIIDAVDGGEVRGGIMGTTILGILGAIIGGFLSNLIFGINLVEVSVRGLLVAVVGGLILSLVSRLILRDKRKIKT